MAYERFVQLAPLNADLLEAEAALTHNHLSTAESLLLRRLAAAPRDVVAMRMLAEIATRREHYAESERLLDECLKLAPGYSRARFDLVQVLHIQQKAAATLPLLDRLLAFEPRNLRYRTAQARAHSLLGDSERAARILSGLLTEVPDSVIIWLYYGHALRAAGHLDEASHAYRKSVELKPGFGEAWFSLANVKTFRFNAPDISAMHAQLAQESLSDNDRLKIEFALGKAFEDECEFGASYAHYSRGNSIRRSQFSYDGESFTQILERTQRLYSRKFFASRVGWGNDTTAPIFVVGLPRSGSSLIEQILASHSNVEGSGELPEVMSFAMELWSRTKTSYPEPVAEVSRHEIEDFAVRYLSRTQAYRPSRKPRFVDKMLSNFIHLGFIHLMFPNAAIIDARRHPLGCGLSCFKQLFTSAQKFTYDLREFGRYYRDYVELMDHFDAVLPGRVYRAHYEQLVADPRREVRKLLDYCRLSFEEQCLRFYENTRVIHTISAEQVRRPIYSDSVEHWRNYEPWLAPLKEELGDLTEQYPRIAPALRQDYA